jgi:hypothetical protein
MSSQFYSEWRAVQNSFANPKFTGVFAATLRGQKSVATRISLKTLSRFEHPKFAVIAGVGSDAAHLFREEPILCFIDELLHPLERSPMPSGEGG